MHEEPTNAPSPQAMPYRGAARAINGQQPMPAAEFNALSPVGRLISDTVDALVVEVFGSAQQRNELHAYMNRNGGR
jgi:hypothetical protein